ncbi:hypothetical protein H7J86_24215 [Mycobacterium hackensackense]|uniref:hypothetical protein n=1 Tax=Mycobacterium hackensackense TaxID=228909 RepID=UPI0022658978|nr:hypothetical protein [Mycobacterium hackensackense]MCV7255272.1 hypothetical protein [Mycobacterium hackensackense]
MPKGTTFRTDIVLGEKYRDTATGFEGTATAVYFYEHACERVNLKGLNTQGEVLDYVFDAPELVHAVTAARPTVTKAGGPRGRTPVAR